MKVGFLTYGMEHSLTGIGRYTVELTRALRDLDAGLEITLLNPYRDSKLGWYEEFPTHPVPRLQKIYGAAALGSVDLHRAAQTLGLDIVHDPCGIAPFIGQRGAYRRVTTVHDAVPLVYPNTQPLATRMIFRTLVPAARWTTDAVLTVSEASASDLTRLLGLPSERVHVTPCGVRMPEAQTPDALAEVRRRMNVPERYLLYVGALHPRKNLKGVLEAYTLLRERLSAAGTDEVGLVIVGPASWGSRAREELGQAFDMTGVQFTGFVTDEDLSALYFGTLGLVYPSYYEGFGLPALEGMAHGAPVITSNTSSLPEVVGDAALTVDPARSDEIADAMHRLVTDPALRASLSGRGRERARTFTWQRMAEQTLAVYRSILQA
ncbi:glycosyltransferase family 4 protein [Deinococcus aquiradiocola]|uniref:Glycosyl transferase family 1 n=1 Tax=Deinococcus aquiradiocola TaxID=393059 RepID=A0A917PG95_9DEIO|nr:glycosyltransferase family 1 protein [Deinococcus aquiradiocola]GGJ75820.1 glycosyl transferase family 1 [Deinococcus aquiradiocola]